jgi:hypothetical protein
MRDFGMPVRAVIRLTGLTLGSWVLWTGWFGKSLVSHRKRIQEKQAKRIRQFTRGWTE